MELALVLTSKCTAACNHCSTSCGPHRNDALSREQISRLMDEAAAIDDGVPLYFHITGGEPFLDFELLVETVAHGAKLDGYVSCLTNAFWARSAQIARQKLHRLKEAGLTRLAVSVSRFHQHYVPLRNARLALEAAADLGLETELKGAVLRSDLHPDGTLTRWRNELDADEINIFPILPWLRDNAAPIDESEYYREPGLPADLCPDEIVCIEADGQAMSCCGQAPASGFLVIGNAQRESLATIHSRFRDAGRQKILREEGPIAFARAAINAGVGHRLRDSYAGACDLCVHVGSDPELRRVADELSAMRAPRTQSSSPETKIHRRVRKNNNGSSSD